MDGLFFWIPRCGSTGFNPIPFRYEDTRKGSSIKNLLAE